MLLQLQLLSASQFSLPIWHLSHSRKHVLLLSLGLDGVDTFLHFLRSKWWKQTNKSVMRLKGNCSVFTTVYNLFEGNYRQDSLPKYQTTFQRGCGFRHCHSPKTKGVRYCLQAINQIGLGGGMLSCISCHLVFALSENSQLSRKYPVFGMHRDMQKLQWLLIWLFCLVVFYKKQLPYGSQNFLLETVFDP